MSNYTKIGFAILVITAFVSCKQSASDSENPQTVAAVTQKDSCDNPDANINCYFLNMPKQLTSTMVIPNNDAEGEKMTISGTIYKKDKKTPYSDVILYAYHTDTKGEYSKKGNEKGVQKWHGSHHGWCKTDKNGNYKIETIRPASYPGTTNPQHIHSAIKVPDNETPFHITDFMFKDDPLLPKTQQNKFSYQGGNGVIDVKKVNNQWIGNRDIVLDTN